MAQKMFYNILLLIATLFLIPLNGGVRARPSPEESNTKMLVDPSEYNGNLSVETIRKVQQCEINGSTMELCMRCAKVTKSEIIYPMCCNNDDGIKDWCHAYVYYGDDEGY
ncbi:LOW QUALITY PROTEIN: uncharacterized protein LOC111071034 [Drosophila obscura]|uniref:LOW QUALITY PROTEIN: uncharacterized protein LOC111071034 n=1 Tax=Drosophila obscura TaxID=7282 RepID=UPI001BB1ADC4|nr:LOW QUALITY PROTEIN: uncharacterized protein LOC111071034 [Drosophila obscura]